MPPKVQVSEERILDHAVKIVRQHGMSVLNARTLADTLSCSVQPIFRTFHSMGELKERVTAFVAEDYQRRLMEGLAESNPNEWLADGLYPICPRGKTVLQTALLGQVLEKAYGADYTSLLNDYLADGLAMKDTCVSNGDADFDGNWQWEDGDAYIPAGAVVSDITDMLLYAQAQLGEDPVLTLCHQPLKRVDDSDKWDRMAGLGIDEIGMSWMADTENGIVWHNGGTGVHSSYLGFCPEKNTAVVVLSNLSQDEDIPATTIGFKKLLEVSSINFSSKEK